MKLIPHEKFEIFGSDDHHYILYAGSFNRQMYCPDNQLVFREIHQLGYGGSNEEHHFSFEDAHDGGRRHDVWRVDDLVLLDGDKIGRKRYTYRGNDDEGTPFVTIEGRDFILDDAALKRHNLTTEDVVANKPGNIRVMQDDLLLGGKLLRPKQVKESGVQYMRLPTVRKPEYLFRLADGQFVYVSADKYNYTYESFRVFIGDGKTMREVPVRDVNRLRDGGSTYVKTDEALLFSPTPFNKQAKPTWGKQEATGLDPKDFDISDTEDGVTITARS